MSSNPSLTTLSPTILGAIRRFRRVVILLVVIGALAALLETTLAGKVYAAKAGIAISPLPASLSTPGSASTHLTPSAYTNEQVTLLESEPVAAAAADTVNAAFPSAHLTAQKLQGAISVKLPSAASSGTATTTTQVTVSLGNPKVAAAAANAVVNAYIAAMKAQIRSQAASSEAALDAAITQTKNELATITVPTKPSKTTTTTTTTSPKSKTTAPKTAKSTTTTSPRTTTTTTPRTTTTTTPRTTTTTAPTTTTTTSSSSSSSSSSAVSSSSATGADSSNSTSTTTTTTSPADSLGSPNALTSYVRSAHRVETGTERRVELLAGSSSTPTTAGAGSSAGSTTTTTSPSGSTTTTTTSPATAATNAANAAERAVLTSTLANLSRSKAQIAVNEAVDLAYHPLVLPATVPSGASNGHTFRNVVIGALAGLVLGVVIAFALSSTRRRFEQASDPEHVYHVPLIASVPAFAVPTWTQVGLPVLTDPTEEAAESYRAMATALRGMRGDADCLVVVFSAADLGAGSTTTVANCALVLAEMEEQVLAVDADPLLQGLTLSLVEDGPGGAIPQRLSGFSEFLSGAPLSDTMVPALRSPRLTVLPSGRNSGMAIDRWPSKVLRRGLERLSADFDFVLIDTPPVGVSSFAMDLIAATEHVIVVVPHHDLVDPHEDVARRLRFTGATHVGYVYNGAPANSRFSPYYPVLGNTPNRPLPARPASAVRVVGERVPIAASGSEAGYTASPYDEESYGGDAYGEEPYGRDQVGGPAYEDNDFFPSASLPTGGQTEPGSGHEALGPAPFADTGSVAVVPGEDPFDLGPDPERPSRRWRRRSQGARRRVARSFDDETAADDGAQQGGEGQGGEEAAHPDTPDSPDDSSAASDTEAEDDGGAPSSAAEKAEHRDAPDAPDTPDNPDGPRTPGAAGAGAGQVREDDTGMVPAVRDDDTGVVPQVREDDTGVVPQVRRGANGVVDEQLPTEAVGTSPVRVHVDNVTSVLPSVTSSGRQRPRTTGAKATRTNAGGTTGTSAKAKSSPAINGEQPQRPVRRNGRRTGGGGSSDAS